MPAGMPALLSLSIELLPGAERLNRLTLASSLLSSRPPVEKREAKALVQKSRAFAFLMINGKFDA